MAKTANGKIMLLSKCTACNDIYQRATDKGTV